MQLVKPSATIMEDYLQTLTPEQRIDYVGSVCYQRPPKTTREEAVQFCKSMVSKGHAATLEMVRIHLRVPGWAARAIHSKYIDIDAVPDDTFCFVSGSIRAFIEAEGQGAHLVRDCFLGRNISLFEERHLRGVHTGISFVNFEDVPWTHKHVAVKFITNRVVTHELVRHRPCAFLQESQRFCRYETDGLTIIEPVWFSAATPQRQDKFLCAMQTLEDLYCEMRKEGYSPQKARTGLPNCTKTELWVYASLPEWKHIFSLRDSPAADPEMQRLMAPLHVQFLEKYPEMRGGK